MSANDNQSHRQEDDEVGWLKAVLVHLKRATSWRIAMLEPMPKEAKVLDQSEVSNDLVRAYLVWRRSMLLVSLPSIFLSAVLAWVNLASFYEDDKAVLNGFGDFIYFIPSAASTVLCLVIVVVLFRWSHWRQTARLFRIGWAVSFVLPFLPAIFPISFLLESCETLRGAQDCRDNAADWDDTVALVEFGLAVQYAIQLFPILVTVPGGLSRASLKIRGLLPESTLSSWILVISAPFQSIIFLMALVLLIQLSGNIPLFVGTILLFWAPWIYVIRRKVYVGVPTEEREKQLDKTQFIIGLSVKLGGLFFLVWAFTGDVFGIPILGSDCTGNGTDDGTDDSTDNQVCIMSYDTLIRVIFEAMGRTLVTTVLFTDALLRMTVTNWRQDTGRREADNGKSIDEKFAGIEFCISSDESKESRSKSDKEEDSDKTSGSDQLDV